MSDLGRRLRALERRSPAPDADGWAAALTGLTTDELRALLADHDGGAPSAAVRALDGDP